MATDVLSDKPQVQFVEESRGFSDTATVALGPTIVSLLKPLASLKLTVALLAMSIFIVLAGTMAQVDKDIWEVVDKYFRCAVAWIPLQIFFPPSFFPSKPQVPGQFPFPGGWLIGALMFLNLAAAHGLRFKPQAKGLRLWSGCGVFALGGLATWMVVTTGSSSGGLQHESWIGWNQLWILLKLGLTAGEIGLIVWICRLRKETGSNARLEALKFLGGLALCLVQGMTAAWLWAAGDDGQLSDSSMRILW